MKAALYFHFQSKGALWLSGCSRQPAINGPHWMRSDRLIGRSTAQTHVWAIIVGAEVAARAHRGCPSINLNAELSDCDHPAQHSIEAHKACQWNGFFVCL